MKPVYLWVLLGAVAVYFLFIRKGAPVAISGSATVSTGTGATPYTGYAAGATPPGVGILGGAAPPAPAPGNSTGATLAGVGSLLGGIGSLAGGLLGGIGNIGSSSSSGGYVDSSSTDDYGSFF